MVVGFGCGFEIGGIGEAAHAGFGRGKVGAFGGQHVERWDV